MYAFREREKILDLFESLSGSRMMCNYMRFGGCRVRSAARAGWSRRSKLSPISRSSSTSSKRCSLANEILMARTPGRRRACRRNSPSTPASPARCCAPAASNYDIRKVDKYGIYDRFEFRVPLGEHGDVFDRYMIRVLEMRESLKILEQALARDSRRADHGSEGEAPRLPPESRRSLRPHRRTEGRTRVLSDQRWQPESVSLSRKDCRQHPLHGADPHVGAGGGGARGRDRRELADAAMRVARTRRSGDPSEVGMPIPEQTVLLSPVEAACAPQDHLEARERRSACVPTAERGPSSRPRSSAWTTGPTACMPSAGWRAGRTGRASPLPRRGGRCAQHRAPRSGHPMRGPDHLAEVVTALSRAPAAGTWSANIATASTASSVPMPWASSCPPEGTTAGSTACTGIPRSSRRPTSTGRPTAAADPARRRRTRARASDREDRRLLVRPHSPTTSAGRARS